MARPSSSSRIQSGNSRLGTVLRFREKSAASGIKSLENGGFKVAASSDFKSAAAVPNDLSGADIQYFERFGIAIVRGEQERLNSMLNKNAIGRETTTRPERTYRAIGAGERHSFYGLDRFGGGDRADIEGYLSGYRDGVVNLVGSLIGQRVAGSKSEADFDETTSTWGLQLIKAVDSKWSGAGIKVAVLDTGFDDTHSDFQDRSVTKKLFATRSSDGDMHGHGTHCIGTACGPRKPSSGPRYGVAYEAEIYAGKVLGDDGFGTDRSIIAGIEWALEQGCDIISMSLGAMTMEGDLPNEDYEHIGQVCLDANALIVAAAGNESARPHQLSPVASPANASTIMAVAAIDSRLRIAKFSNAGINSRQEVDIAAPGVAVLSSLPGGRYDRLDGTSMATPHVAGVAALIAQSDRKYRGWALWSRLMQMARPLDAAARDVGRGLLQAP